MRAIVDIEDRGGELFATVTAPGLTLPERPVRWAATILVAKDEQITGDQAERLAVTVDNGTATPADLHRYGTLLFDAAFGRQTWRELTAAASPRLELAIRGPQSPRWEALHDGTHPVAAKGTPVTIVRLIHTINVDFLPNAPSSLVPVTSIPRLLYAVGSRLSDPKIRPGAEFMGIMRHLERKGGAVQPRVLEQATMESLTHQLERFQPDVLHMISHGIRDAIDDQVKLELHPEQSGDPGAELITAKGLLDVFAAAAHTPKMIVLSACKTASPGSAGSLSPDGQSFAAELVAGGVPVVVAMAGDVSDTACRIFARALTHAISDGVPVAEAVTIGRRAAFHKGTGPDSGHWLLPTVFLADHLPAGTALVDPTAIENARKRCQLLDLDWEPVFCGRGEFVTLMDRVLDAEDPLNVLVAHTDDGTKSYGGMRLLRELSARAVRDGWLPVLLGPFDEDPPKTCEAFAEALSERLADMRADLGLPWRDASDRLAQAAASGPKALTQAIRETFTELVADLPAGDPVRAGPRPRVVLLCHRIDQWEDVLPGFFGPGHKLIGSRGLGSGDYPVPVVLTGADTADLKRSRLERCSGAAWVKFVPLGRFRMDDDDPEDILAYLWWLLNPEEGPVFAPRRGSDHDEVARALRYAMRDVIYDKGALFGQAAALRYLFTSGQDTDLLAAYLKAAP